MRHGRMIPSPRLIQTSLAATAVFALAACGSSASSTDSTDVAAPNGTVTLVTHDSFYLPDELIADFTATTGYALDVVAPGDGGVLANQLILTRQSPLGDVAFGVDNTMASRAVNENVFVPYTSPAAAGEFDTFDGTLTAIDQGSVCLNVDHQWFAENGVAEPTTFEDLVLPEYKGLTVITNPSSSTPGLSFLLATISHFGDGWQQYWSDLFDNGLRVDDGWSDAYYVDFSGSEGQGSYPIVLSYSSSPSAEVGDDGQPTTGIIESTCINTVEYAGVLANAANPEGAQAFIDWMLSDSVQSALPDAMYMYPVNPQIALPEAWEAAAPLPADPIWMDPAEIAANRDTWLQQWLDIVG